MCTRILLRYRESSGNPCAYIARILASRYHGGSFISPDVPLVLLSRGCPNASAAPTIDRWKRVAAVGRPAGRSVACSLARSLARSFAVGEELLGDSKLIYTWDVLAR